MPPGTREALIDAAERLLDEGGLPAVTLRAVGAQAGVSHNAPYKHFADREALLAAVATRELARYADIAADSSIREFLRWQVESAAAHPARFKLVYGPWKTASDELVETAHQATEALHAAVERAQADGELPAGNRDRVASLLRATAHGAADLALAGHLARDGKGKADPIDVVDDLLAALRAR